MTRSVAILATAVVVAALIIAGTYAWTVVGAVGPELPLRIVGDYPLSGSTSRFDYASLDESRGVLWVAHMGDGSVEAFDVKANHVTRTISLGPTANVRGILAARGNVYAAAQGLGAVVVLDGSTGKYLATVPAEDGDGLAYDPVTQRVFVSDELAGRDIVIDARTNRAITGVALDGEAGNTQYDPVSHHIFVGVQTRDEVAEIDPVTLKVVRRYALPGCSSSHSVVIDASERAAFIGCQHNARLVRLDLRSGKVTGSGGVGIGIDVMALDDGLHRLYFASESGVVSVYDVRNGGLKRVAQAMLHLNAHVVAVDQSTHRVYFPLQSVNGKPVMRVMAPL
jgi:DNA-binding beta-propeller fold protein YncE